MYPSTPLYRRFLIRVITSEAATMQTFDIATSFPALSGEPVTEAHVKFCRYKGHAVHTSDGVRSHYCPRCGDNTNVIGWHGEAGRITFAGHSGAFIRWDAASPASPALWYTWADIMSWADHTPARMNGCGCDNSSTDDFYTYNG